MTFLRYLYTANSEQGWRFRNDPRPEPMAFLVSAAKKQRSEVKLANLTEEEKQPFHEAKLKEVQSWLDTKTVCKILRHRIPESSIFKRRWILTWKKILKQTRI